MMTSARGNNLSRSLDGMDHGRRTRAPGHSQDVDMKRREHALDLFADRAISHQEYCFAGELLDHNGRMQLTSIVRQLLVDPSRFGAAPPIAGPLEIEIDRKLLQHGENGGDRPFRGRDVVRASRVTDRHMRTHGAGDPVRAGHQRKNKANPAQVRPDALRSGGVRIRNPHLDLDVVPSKPSANGTRSIPSGRQFSSLESRVTG